MYASPRPSDSRRDAELGIVDIVLALRHPPVDDVMPHWSTSFLQPCCVRSDSLEQVYRPLAAGPFGRTLIQRTGQLHVPGRRRPRSAGHPGHLISLGEHVSGVSRSDAVDALCGHIAERLRPPTYGVRPEYG